MKARAELVYTCTYKSNGYELSPLCDESIISRDELAEFLAFNGTEVLLCGDGAADERDGDAGRRRPGGGSRGTGREEVRGP